ncbi:MAG: tetratricopeptide repeat-containing serine protease family protein [Leptolyngbyaceae cyanobacterium bins.302]|nr:tetratricopeptide repeat-containing serine protease family protein [Leptolyngbyaceae cyanobacterium bins.302]
MKWTETFAPLPPNSLIPIPHPPSPMHPFPALPTFLLASTIALVQIQPAAALSANQVQQIAEGFTVLVDGANPGSGVIVARAGDTYYVLTARHVVGTPDGYMIVSASGDRHPVDYSRVVKLAGVDLALVPFTSRRIYPIATLANYPYDASFRNVYTAGWTAYRTRAFTAGILSDRSFALALTQGLRQEGYDLFYSNLTQVGMSGGAVLDSEGRVIGIHGLAEGEEVNDGQRGITRIKRGFSSGIPISTFLNRVDQTGLRLSFQFNNTPPAQITVQQPTGPLEPVGNATSAVEWTNRGNQLYRLGQFEAALTALNQAVRLNPDLHAAWYDRGNVLFALRRSAEALESYDRAIQLKPDLYSVWRDRGVLLAALNKFDAALGSFDRATLLKPDDYVLWYMRGNLLNKDFRDYSGAIASYDRALAINPNFADAWMGKGRALHEQNRYDTALVAFQQSLRLDPNLSVAWILQARTLNIMGQRQAAINSLQRALQLKPNDPEALRLLATLQ